MADNQRYRGSVEIDGDYLDIVGMVTGTGRRLVVMSPRQHEGTYPAEAQFTMLEAKNIARALDCAASSVSIENDPPIEDLYRCTRVDLGNDRCIRVAGHDGNHVPGCLRPFS